MSKGMYAELDGTRQAAQQARELVRHMLGEDHPSVSDAALVASELVANAVAHSRSGQPGGTLILAVELSQQPPSVCIRIRDAGGPGAPQVAKASPSGEHGRGLRIIAALAAEWGTEPNGPGRATWCRIATGELSHPAGKPAPPSARRAQAAISAADAVGGRSQRKDAAHVPNQACSRGTGHEYNLGGPPKWVAVTWVNPQLRGRVQRDGTTLNDVWPASMRRDIEPQADREAEP
jgi:anti-sigma regulatory factor (Ser/Thr protein kinase)